VAEEIINEDLYIRQRGKKCYINTIEKTKHGI
jgi:hypothetical protein